MVMTGMCGGRSSRASMRARSSTLLLDDGLVSYAAGSGCMRARSGMVALFSHVPRIYSMSINRKKIYK